MEEERAEKIADKIMEKIEKRLEIEDFVNIYNWFSLQYLYMDIINILKEQNEQ